jgi:superfamily I DNA and/or RNA helicase
LLEASPEQQICVLTPYSKQVQVIRSTLQQEALLLQRKRKQSATSLSSSSTLSSSTLSPSSNNIMKLINNIRIGTIDSFQGQECDIVLFSSVRSNTINELGFVRDPRRLCVALTRARKGLVVVGDTSSLNSCRHWNSFIEYCISKKCLINDDDDDGNQNGKDKEETTMNLGKRISSLDDEFFGLFS